MIVATRPDPTVRPPSRYQTDVLRCTNGGFSCDSCGKIRIFRCVCIIFFDFVIMVLSNLNILFPNQIKRNTFFPFVVLFLGNNNLPLFFLLSILFFANSHPILVLPTFSLSAIYRCVTRSCNRVVRKNLYHRKLSCIPFLSRYSCRNFSLSSSVGAVLNLLYISRFTIASSFCSKPNRIFSSPS